MCDVILSHCDVSVQSVAPSLYEKKRRRPLYWLVTNSHDANMRTQHHLFLLPFLTFLNKQRILLEEYVFYDIIDPG